MIHVANLHEMCEILHIDKTTGAKHWRKWPHFLMNYLNGKPFLMVLVRRGRLSPAPWMIYITSLTASTSATL